MKRMTMKEYVDSRFKRIQDSINNYANGKDVDQIELLDDNISVEEINNKVKRLTAHGDIRNKVKPEDIILDANHRFINDIQEEKIKEMINANPNDRANLRKAFVSLLWAAFMSILFKEIFDPGYKEIMKSYSSDDVLASAMTYVVYNGGK